MPTHLGGEHLQMRCALRLIKDHPRLKNHLLYIESNMKILLRIFPVSFPKGFCNHYSIIILYVEKDNHFQKAFKVKIVAQLEFFSEKATYFSVAFSTTYQSILALFTWEGDFLQNSTDNANFHLCGWTIHTKHAVLPILHLITMKIVDFWLKMFRKGISNSTTFLTYLLCLLFGLSRGKKTFKLAVMFLFRNTLAIKRSLRSRNCQPRRTECD